MDNLQDNIQTEPLAEPAITQTQKFILIPGVAEIVNSITGEVTQAAKPPYEVTIDISDTQQKFCWRMRDNEDNRTSWTRCYDIPLFMRSKHGTVVMFTPYYDSNDCIRAQDCWKPALLEFGHAFVLTPPPAAAASNFVYNCLAAILPH